MTTEGMPPPAILDNATAEDWDAGRRVADAVNLHVAVQRAENRDRPGFVAIRLSDGRSPDGVLYDTRRDAVRHHLHDLTLTYIKVPRHTMGEHEATIVLMLMRQARARGVIFSEEEVITPQLTELIPRAFVRRRLRGNPNE